MIAALAALALGALPPGSARYRFEIGGEPVGFAEISVACAHETCRTTFASVRRGPEDAGGAVTSWRAEIEVDRDGRFRGGSLRVASGGPAVARRGLPGLVPASVAELVLLAETPGDGSERCIEAFEEESPDVPPFAACARREGGEVVAVLDGAAMRIAPAADGFPQTIELPGQTARFVRDPLARVPSEAPRLHGTAVPGPADPRAAASFCGVTRDAPPPSVDASALPPPAAPGASCREKTAAWLARAAQGGIRGRTAVGVAWDGTRFVWHAWAEARLGGAWIPVDPTFGESPARSPRFTVATFEDARGRRRAGERILACWGRRGVESGGR